jgi:hypothetical protein
VRCAFLRRAEGGGARKNRANTVHVPAAAMLLTTHGSVHPWTGSLVGRHTETSPDHDLRRNRFSRSIGRATFTPQAGTDTGVVAKVVMH